MAKSDTVKARFEQILAADKEIRKADYITPLLKFGVNIEKSAAKGSSFDSNPFVVESDTPLARAFGAADLDPANKLHWRQLLHIFASAHYPNKKSKEFGTDDKHYEILRDYEKTKSRKKKWNSELDIAIEMNKLFDYKTDAETLKRTITTARSEVLKDLVEITKSRLEDSNIAGQTADDIANSVAAHIFPEAWKSGRK